jgi:hypothetical protein
MSIVIPSLRLYFTRTWLDRCLGRIVRDITSDRNHILCD